MSHIFIKFSDLLRLCGKEIVMFQQFLDLDQKIAMDQINFIMILLRIFSQVLNLILQYFQYRISGI